MYILTETQPPTPLSDMLYISKVHTSYRCRCKFSIVVHIVECLRPSLGPSVPFRPLFPEKSGKRILEFGAYIVATIPPRILLFSLSHVLLEKVRNGLTTTIRIGDDYI